MDAPWKIHYQVLGSTAWCYGCCFYLYGICFVIVRLLSENVKSLISLTRELWLVQTNNRHKTIWELDIKTINSWAKPFIHSMYFIQLVSGCLQSAFNRLMVGGRRYSHKRYVRGRCALEKIWQRKWMSKNDMQPCNNNNSWWKYEWLQ